MALGVTSDLNAYAILKEYYGDQVVEFLVSRNSPVLKDLRKKRIGGKYVPLPAAVYGSGAVSADYTQVTKQATNSYNGQSFLVTPGRLFASFVLDPSEYLASQTNRGAFIEVFALRAELAMDDLRKTLASALYASGYLELGPVRAVDTSFLYVDVDASTAMALTPSNSAGTGSQVLFAPTTVGAYRTSTPATISSIVMQGSTGYARVTFTAAIPATVAVNDLLMLAGGRDINGNPNAPVGLAGWLPSTGGRTGTAWNTQIATQFFGINRSVAPDRLAGQFVQRGASESYTQALLRLLKACRRGGGVPDMIIVNDDDYGIIAQEALANRTFYQNINSTGKEARNKVTQGIDQFQMSFSTSWIDRVYDDPFCPRGVAYLLDMSVVELYSLTNIDPVLEDGGFTSGNQPGAPKAGEGMTPTTRFEFLVDDMYTTTPIDLQSGKGLRVDFQAFLAFVVKAPAKCGVCLF